MWIDVDKWQEIFASIERHKLRTALTAFGVAWGIFMLVLLLGAVNGLKTSFEYQFADDSLNSIWIWRGRTSKPHKGLKEGRSIRFDNSDYKYINENVEDIFASSGRFWMSGSLVTTYGDKALSFNTRAVHPGHKVLENTIIETGRYLNQRDIDEFRKVVVMGQVAERQLFGEESAIGKEIKIGDAIYTVVGTFSDTGGENEMKRLYVPISTAQKIYGDGKSMDQMMFDAGSNRSIGEMLALENEIHTTLASRKQFAKDDRQAIWVRNNAENFEEFNSLFKAFGVITWIIGVFSIIAGVIGVSNIMLIIVKDRTKEIGIRKALGATPGSIVAMIIQESILITGVAGYVGMAVGVGVIALATGVETEYFRHPSVDIGIIISATLILVIAGALAGLLPAMKAALINPVVAMKTE